VAIVETSSSLFTTLDTMITSYKGSAIVVDGEGRYQGVVDFDTVLEAINAMRPEEQTRDRAKRDGQTGDGGR
jgi:osmoprotectant transport system ATP-binding protein